MNASNPLPGAFRAMPRTGVIFVTSEAQKRGFDPAHGGTDWCNLGQGQPEAGALPNACPRIESIPTQEEDHEYAPVSGLWEARQAIAEMYNDLYRQGKASKYTAANVSICGGGRTALTRAVASLGRINLGHFLPDYTAYEEMLEAFSSFTSIPILLEGNRGYQFSVDELRREILGRGLGALLMSNPCNPTGKVVQGKELGDWVDTARELDCTLLMDEFYSNYIWVGANGGAPMVSAAAHVDDVNQDPVVLFNGLTKNWRYPGWRVCWAVGPESVIESISSAGSFLDGGGSRPLQRAALPLLKSAFVDQETRAIQSVFGHKRQVLLQGLERLGITMDVYPHGTFYAWGNLSGLPNGLNDGMDFFRAALDKKVIVVPGEFFDVNPGRRRPGRVSRFRSYARFSFGPKLEAVEEGLNRLAELIHEHE